MTAQDIPESVDEITEVAAVRPLTVAFHTTTSQKAWLTTFVDLVCLMLTFFILLFAVAEPREARWQNTIEGFGAAFSTVHTAPGDNSDTQRATALSEAQTLQTADSEYLRSLLTARLKDAGYRDAFTLRETATHIAVTPKIETFRRGAPELMLPAEQKLRVLLSALVAFETPLRFLLLQPRGEVTSDSPYSNDWMLGLARGDDLRKRLAAAGLRADTPLTVQLTPLSGAGLTIMIDKDR